MQRLGQPPMSAVPRTGRAPPQTPQVIGRTRANPDTGDMGAIALDSSPLTISDVCRELDISMTQKRLYWIAEDCARCPMPGRYTTFKTMDGSDKIYYVDSLSGQRLDENPVILYYRYFVNAVRDEAAKDIQRVWRGYQSRQRTWIIVVVLENRKKAAVKINSMARGFLARKKTHVMRAIMRHHRDEQVAMTKILMVVRLQRVTRRWLANMKGGLGSLGFLSHPARVLAQTNAVEEIIESVLWDETVGIAHDVIARRKTEEPSERVIAQTEVTDDIITEFVVSIVPEFVTEVINFEFVRRTWHKRFEAETICNTVMHKACDRVLHDDLSRYEEVHKREQHLLQVRKLALRLSDSITSVAVEGTISKHKSDAKLVKRIQVNSIAIAQKAVAEGKVRAGRIIRAERKEKELDMDATQFTNRAMARASDDTRSLVLLASTRRTQKHFKNAIESRAVLERNRTKKLKYTQMATRARAVELAHDMLFVGVQLRTAKMTYLDQMDMDIHVDNFVEENIQMAVATEIECQQQQRALEQESALKIQLAYRAYRARTIMDAKRLLRGKWKMTSIQARFYDMATVKFRQNMQKRAMAVNLISKYYRRYISRKKERQLHWACAIRIQRLYRRYIENRENRQQMQQWVSLLEQKTRLNQFLVDVRTNTYRLDAAIRIQVFMRDYWDMLRRRKVWRAAIEESRRFTVENREERKQQFYMAWFAICRVLRRLMKWLWRARDRVRMNDSGEMTHLGQGFRMDEHQQWEMVKMESTRYRLEMEKREAEAIQWEADRHSVERRKFDVSQLLREIKEEKKKRQMSEQDYTQLQLRTDVLERDFEETKERLEKAQSEIRKLYQYGVGTKIRLTDTVQAPTVRDDVAKKKVEDTLNSDTLGVVPQDYEKKVEWSQKILEVKTLLDVLESFYHPFSTFSLPALPPRPDDPDDLYPDEELLGIQRSNMARKKYLKQLESKRRKEKEALALEFQDFCLGHNPEEIGQWVMDRALEGRMNAKREAAALCLQRYVRAFLNVTKEERVWKLNLELRAREDLENMLNDVRVKTQTQIMYEKKQTANVKAMKASLRKARLEEMRKRNMARGNESETGLGLSSEPSGILPSNVSILSIASTAASKASSRRGRPTSAAVVRDASTSRKKRPASAGIDTIRNTYQGGQKYRYVPKYENLNGFKQASRQKREQEIVNAKNAMDDMEQQSPDILDYEQHFGKVYQPDKHLDRMNVYAPGKSAYSLVEKPRQPAPRNRAGQAWNENFNSPSHSATVLAPIDNGPKVAKRELPEIKTISGKAMKSTKGTHNAVHKSRLSARANAGYGWR